MNKPVKPAYDETTAQTVAEHDAWVREQVEIALKTKREGRTTYKSLDEIAAKFGSNAG